jgi:hypothetical protein
MQEGTVNSRKSKFRTPNPEEDAIFVAAYEDLKRNNKAFTPAVQMLMDRVANVHQYKASDLERQGFIANLITKERARTNFLIDWDSYISEFWCGVFMSMDQAALYGAQFKRKKNGVIYEVPDTKTEMNAVNWLRRQGFFAARKVLDSTYGSQLMQTCDDCSFVGPVTAMVDEITEVAAMSTHNRTCPPACPHCGSDDTRGGPVNRLGPTAKCNACNKGWQRQMIRKCQSCGSRRVQLQPKSAGVEPSDMLPPEYITEEHDPETILANTEARQHIKKIFQRTHDALPIDHASADGSSQTRKLLKIIADMDTTTSRDICSKCRKEDARSCGSITFDLNACYNYSKKIGGYFGYTGALANSRVAKIRKHLAKTLQDMTEEGDVIAAELVLELSRSPKLAGLL